MIQIIFVGNFGKLNFLGGVKPFISKKVSELAKISPETKKFRDTIEWNGISVGFKVTKIGNVYRIS